MAYGLNSIINHLIPRLRSPSASLWGRLRQSWLLCVWLPPALCTCFLLFAWFLSPSLLQPRPWRPSNWMVFPRTKLFWGLPWFCALCWQWWSYFYAWYTSIWRARCYRRLWAYLGSLKVTYVLTFDRVPEKYLARLHTYKQLHLLGLPNQVHDLRLVLQSTDLLWKLLLPSLPNLENKSLSALVAGGEQVVFERVEEQASKVRWSWRAHWSKILQPSSLDILEYLYVAFPKSDKQSSIRSICMNLGDLTGKFMLIDDEASISIDNVDPSISWGRINHLVDFIQVQSDYILAVPINHFRQLVVNIPILNESNLGLFMSLNTSMLPSDSPTTIIILVTEKIKHRVSIG